MTEVYNDSELEKYGIWICKTLKQTLDVIPAEFLLRSISPKSNSALIIFQGNIFNARAQEYVYFLIKV